MINNVTNVLSGTETYSLIDFRETNTMGEEVNTEQLFSEAFKKRATTQLRIYSRTYRESTMKQTSPPLILQ